MERRFVYLTSPFFLQCYNPQHSSFKISFDIWLIKGVWVIRSPALIFGPRPP